MTTKQGTMQQLCGRLAAYAAVGLWVIFTAAGCTLNGSERVIGSNVVAALSGEADEAFARAYEPMPLVFPRDHGAHPAYRTEWWYFTGNLADDQGREYGY